MNYFQFHIGDYLRDTSHLSLLEHGIYCRLLQTYYTRECGLEDAETARLIVARSKEEREALKTVLNEFFVLEGGVWLHRRCDEEIEKFHDKQSKASRSASARWQKQSTHTERNANAMRTHSEGNAPNNQEPITKNQTEANASVGAAKPRPSRKCPEAFVVDDEMRSWAMEMAPWLDLQRETDKFRDHTFKTALTDWRGAWRNWIRRASEGPPGRAAVVPINRQEALEQRNRQAAARWLEGEASAAE